MCVSGESDTTFHLSETILVYFLHSIASCDAMCLCQEGEVALRNAAHVVLDDVLRLGHDFGTHIEEYREVLFQWQQVLQLGQARQHGDIVDGDTKAHHIQHARNNPALFDTRGHRHAMGSHEMDQLRDRPRGFLRAPTSFL